MASPPGSRCGLEADSLGLTETTVSGLPPFADTRRMPAGPPPKRIWLSELQLAPYGRGLSQMVTASPPVLTGRRFHVIAAVAAAITTAVSTMGIARFQSGRRANVGSMRSSLPY